MVTGVNKVLKTQLGITDIVLELCVNNVHNLYIIFDTARYFKHNHSDSLLVVNYSA